jgi:superfamily II DNA/RNA helicase
MKVFDVRGPGMDQWLVKRLESWGIEELTDIQQRALAAGIADSRSLVVSAPTSSGKTLANFLVTTFLEVVDWWLQVPDRPPAREAHGLYRALVEPALRG